MIYFNFKWEGTRHHLSCTTLTGDLLQDFRSLVDWLYKVNQRLAGVNQRLASAFSGLVEWLCQRSRMAMQSSSTIFST
jgi:hypothetical protein